MTRKEYLAQYKRAHHEELMQKQREARKRYIDERNAEIKAANFSFNERKRIREANRRKRMFRWQERAETLRREIAELSINPFSHLVKS